MNKPGQHRVVAGTKRGRQFTSSKGSVSADDSRIPADIKEHNRSLEERRLARKMAKGKI